MKITIYELLGLIKDGKAPKKIKYQNRCWEWTGDDYKTYKEAKECFLITGQEYVWVTEFLNDEIEIIEEVEDKEYEDIGELCYNIKEFENDVVKLEYENKTMRIGRVIVDLSTKIDALIRNQKYILEQLNK